MSYYYMRPGQSLLQVGFWRSADGRSERQFPDVREAVDWKWAPGERALVLRYVQSGQEHEAYRGWSDCRICGKMNGSTDLTDGVYVWPEGFAHYIHDHGVRPPADFVAHVLSPLRRR